MTSRPKRPRRAGAPAPSGPLWLWIALAAPCWLACKDPPPPPQGRPAASATQAAWRTPPEAPAREPERFELLSALGDCEVEHEGELFDFGTLGPRTRRAFALLPLDEAHVVRREGASFERLVARDLNLDVWLDERIPQATVTLRVHGGAAKRLQVAIDDQRLGVIRLPANETRIVSTTPGPRLEPGRHRIALRLFGAAAKTSDPLLEIDWLRLGSREISSSYAAPTLDDVVADVALAGVPRRGLVLRAQSTVRCFLWPQAATELRASLGLWGAGSGSAEVRVRRDDAAPKVLTTRNVSGGDNATWAPLSLELERGNGPIALELTATETTRGGRVVFGDPALVRRRTTASDPAIARVAVVVVLSASERARLPPWGPTGGLSTLGALARESTAFSRQRAPTTLPAGVVASLLTGLSPRAHGLETPSNNLPQQARTIAEMVKEASGRTAMFTGVPTTFPPFGFGQGWDVYEGFSPVLDLPAAEPILRGTAWLEQELDPARPAPLLLLFIHARGAHPPWDVSREEAQRLKPNEYAGIVDPRRGGIILGALRERRVHSRRSMRDEDWVRLRALGDASLAKQDAALGALVSLLRRKGVWDETLFVVTGDVAPGAGAALPFDVMGPLDEERLAVPLLTRFPHGAFASKEVQEPTSAEDVAAAVLQSLGLFDRSGLGARGLMAAAAGERPLAGAVQMATLPGGAYAARLETRRLVGHLGEIPRLCALDVDPGCATDVLEREPIAARLLWQATLEAERVASSRPSGATTRIPIELDAETLNALVVWGDRR